MTTTNRPTESAFTPEDLFDSRFPRTDRSVEVHHVALDSDTQDDVRAALILLNRPDRLNALDWDTVLELEDQLQTSDRDPGIRAILVSGRGRAFSSGGDLESYRTLQKDAAAFREFLADLHRVFTGIGRLSKPVVALVNGITAAGGLELLISCDFAIAGASASISDSHLRYGQMGGGGVLTLLPRLIGAARARELIFSSRWLTAYEANDWSLVNRVVPDDELLEAGLAFAREVAARSALSVANAKEVINTILADGMSVEEGIALETDRNIEYCLTSLDAAEGLRAFAEKRTPRFQGK
jgi:enoyl-CoA hydratase/carnithine racemase